MKKLSSFLALTTLLFLGTTSFSLAQGYVPLAPLPGTINPEGGTTNLSTYVAGMIKLLVALGAALAVLFAIIGGTQYVAASINPSAKANALEKVWNALIGLAIILSSYLLLNSINPDLVNFKLELPSVTVRNWIQPTGPGDITSPSGCPDITDPNVLLDTPEAKAMEASNGNAVVFSSNDPAVQANLDQLKKESTNLVVGLAQNGITARVTSAYRPYAYQKHLYEIYDAWMVKKLKDNNDDVCKEIKAKVGGEYSKHGLGSLVSNPDTQRSPHVVGTGVDIQIEGIPYDNFSSLGNIHYTDVNSFMTYEGIKLRWQNIPGDRVHFNLK